MRRNWKPTSWLIRRRQHAIHQQGAGDDALQEIHPLGVADSTVAVIHHIQIKIVEPLPDFARRGVTRHAQDFARGLQ